MQNVAYILSAFIAAWALIFGCVLWLIVRERRLRREVDSLKKRKIEKEGKE